MGVAITVNCKSIGATDICLQVQTMSVVGKLAFRAITMCSRVFEERGNGEGLWTRQEGTDPRFYTLKSHVKGLPNDAWTDEYCLREAYDQIVPWLPLSFQEKTVRFGERQYPVSTNMMKHCIFNFETTVCNRPEQLN